MGRLLDLIEEVDISSYRTQYRIHATQALFRRGIDPHDVERVLIHGEIIEEYDDSLPIRHVLLNGKSERGRPLHVALLVSLIERELTVITVYEPSPTTWERNFTRRTR
jgi:hypothetical protein